jgi:hypothetical protein
MMRSTQYIEEYKFCYCCCAIGTYTDINNISFLGGEGDSAYYG